MSLTPRDVIKRAMRLHGVLASGDDPTADEMSDAMIALNTMKRALFGTLIGPRLSAQGVSGTTWQAENGGEYEIPPGAMVVTAPLSPSAGSRFSVVDAGAAFGVTPCTVSGNGRLIEGSVANLVLNVAGTSRTWWFSGALGGWIREADYLTPDDVIEFPDRLIAYLPYMLAVVIAAEFGADVRADVVAGEAEGRAAFARTYARRAGKTDAPIGLAATPPAPGR